MSGDWIPYNVDLPRKPEVLGIAAATGRSVYEVAGVLLELWAWADARSEDGKICPCSVRLLSGLCPTFDETFADALVKSGWLRVGNDFVEFTNFSAWMGGDSRRRMVASRSRWNRRHKQVNTNQMSASCPPKKRTKRGHDATESALHNSTEQNIRGMNSPLTPSCPETAKTPSSGPQLPLDEERLLTFKTDGEPGEWHLLPSHVSEWSQAFPSLDILGECRKALVWVQADPARRKTAKGMARFLVSWLGKAQNFGAGRKTVDNTKPSRDDQLNRFFGDAE